MARSEDENVRDWYADFVKLADVTDGTPLAKFAGYYLPVTLPLVWKNVYNFDFRPHDVLISTYPKSGTHWVYYIAYLLKTNNFGPVPEVHQFPLMEVEFVRNQLQAISEQEGPRLLITHLGASLLPKHAFKGKVIYVYRNPKDVAVSCYHHYLNLIAFPYNKTFDEFVRQVMSGRLFWGPYSKHLQDVVKAKQEGKPILLLRYEDVKKDVRATIRQIAKHIDVEVDEALVEKIVEATTFAKMRDNNDVNGKVWQKEGLWQEGAVFLRRGAPGAWRDYFTDPQLLAEFNDYIQKNIPEELRAGYD